MSTRKETFWVLFAFEIAANSIICFKLGTWAWLAITTLRGIDTARWMTRES